MFVNTTRPDLLVLPSRSVTPLIKTCAEGSGLPPRSVTSTLTVAVFWMAGVAMAVDATAGATHPMIVAGDGVGLAGAGPEVVAIAERLGAPVYTEQYSTIWN